MLSQTGNDVPEDDDAATAGWSSSDNNNNGSSMSQTAPPESPPSSRSATHEYTGAIPSLPQPSSRSSPAAAAGIVAVPILRSDPLSPPRQPQPPPSAEATAVPYQRGTSRPPPWHDAVSGPTSVSPPVALVVTSGGAKRRHTGIANSTNSNSTATTMNCTGNRSGGSGFTGVAKVQSGKYKSAGGSGHRLHRRRRSVSPSSLLMTSPDRSGDSNGSSSLGHGRRHGAGRPRPASAVSPARQLFAAQRDLCMLAEDVIARHGRPPAVPSAKGNGKAGNGSTQADDGNNEEEGEKEGQQGHPQRSLLHGFLLPAPRQYVSELERRLQEVHKRAVEGKTGKPVVVTVPTTTAPASSLLAAFSPYTTPTAVGARIKTRPRASAPLGKQRDAGGVGVGVGAAQRSLESSPSASAQASSWSTTKSMTAPSPSAADPLLPLSPPAATLSPSPHPNNSLRAPPPYPLAGNIHQRRRRSSVLPDNPRQTILEGSRSGVFTTTTGEMEEDRGGLAGPYTALLRLTSSVRQSLTRVRDQQSMLAAQKQDFARALRAALHGPEGGSAKHDAATGCDEARDSVPSSSSSSTSDALSKVSPIEKVGLTGKGGAATGSAGVREGVGRDRRAQWAPPHGGTLTFYSGRNRHDVEKCSGGGDAPHARREATRDGDDGSETSKLEDAEERDDVVFADALLHLPVTEDDVRAAIAAARDVVVEAGKCRYASYEETSFPSFLPGGKEEEVVSPVPDAEAAVPGKWEDTDDEAFHRRRRLHTQEDSFFFERLLLSLPAALDPAANAHGTATGRRGGGGYLATATATATTVPDGASFLLAAGEEAKMALFTRIPAQTAGKVRRRSERGCSAEAREGEAADSLDLTAEDIVNGAMADEDFRYRRRQQQQQQQQRWRRQSSKVLRQPSTSTPTEVEHGTTDEQASWRQDGGGGGDGDDGCRVRQWRGSSTSTSNGNPSGTSRWRRVGEGGVVPREGYVRRGPPLTPADTFASSLENEGLLAALIHLSEARHLMRERQRRQNKRELQTALDEEYKATVAEVERRRRAAQASATLADEKRKLRTAIDQAHARNRALQEHASLLYDLVSQERVALRRAEVVLEVNAAVHASALHATTDPTEPQQRNVEGTDAAQRGNIGEGSSPSSRGFPVGSGAQEADNTPFTRREEGEGGQAGGVDDIAVYEAALERYHEQRATLMCRPSSLLSPFDPADLSSHPLAPPAAAAAATTEHRTLGQLLAMERTAQMAKAERQRRVQEHGQQTPGGRPFIIPSRPTTARATATANPKASSANARHRPQSVRDRRQGRWIHLLPRDAARGTGHASKDGDGKN